MNIASNPHLEQQGVVVVEPARLVVAVAGMAAAAAY